MIERRMHDRGAEASTRRRFWKLFGLAVLSTGAAFWLLHASRLLRTP